MARRPDEPIQCGESEHADRGDEGSASGKSCPNAFVRRFHFALSQQHPTDGRTRSMRKTPRRPTNIYSSGNRRSSMACVARGTPLSSPSSSTTPAAASKAPAIRARPARLPPRCRAPSPLRSHRQPKSAQPALDADRSDQLPDYGFRQSLPHGERPGRRYPPDCADLVRATHLTPHFACWRLSPPTSGCCDPHANAPRARSSRPMLFAY